MKEFPSSASGEAPKRERKTRKKPVIAPTESPEVSSVKRAMFGRLARKAVLEEQKRGAPEHVEDASKNMRALDDARAAMQSVNQQIDELTSTILDMAEGRSLEDVEKSVASGTEENGMLALMIPMRDTLNIEREEAEKTLASLETQVTKQPRMKKMSAEEHASALSNIEWEMNERIGEEERFETLLGGMQSPYDGQWEKSAFEKFVPYLEETYLVPGAVTNLVLKQYVENEASLSPALLDSVKSAVNTLVRRRVAKKVTQSGLADASLRGRLEQLTYEKENTPGVRREVVDAYLADTSPEKELLRFTGPDAAQIAVREIALREGKANIDELRFVLATFAIEESNVGNSRLPRFMEDDERRVIVAARGGKSFSGVAPEARPILEKHGVDWYGPSKLMEDAVGLLYKAQKYFIELSQVERSVNKALHEDWTTEAQRLIDATVADRAADVVRNLIALEKQVDSVSSDVLRITGNIAKRTENILTLTREDEKNFSADTWNAKLDDLFLVMRELQGGRDRARALESQITRVALGDRNVTSIAPRAQQICEEQHREWKGWLSRALPDTLPKQDVWDISKVASKSGIDRRIERMSTALKEKDDADAKEWWPMVEDMTEKALTKFREQISPYLERAKGLVAELGPLPNDALRVLRTQMLPAAREYVQRVGADAEAKVKSCESAVEKAERNLESAKSKKTELEGKFLRALYGKAIQDAEKEIAQANEKIAEAKRGLTDAKSHRSAVYNVESRLQNSVPTE